MEMRRAFAQRSHPAYWAFVAHRVSGLVLAFFLPVHFLTLGLAIESAAALDGFLRWAEQPLVKVAETVLVILLAVHLAGGVRLLALELVAWSDRQKTWIAASFGFALCAGLLFLLSAQATP
jgi:fumarate reductase subunit D